MASTAGTANRNIIIVPCIVKSWLYSDGPTSVLSGTASWMRMTSARNPGQHEEQERGRDVEHADVGVVDDGQQPQARRRAPGAAQLLAAHAAAAATDWAATRRALRRPAHRRRWRETRHRRLEIRGDGADLLGGKHVERGIRLSGFKCWLRADPRGERAGAHCAAFPRRARPGSPTCVRSGPRVPLPPRSAHVVAYAAAALAKRGLAALRRRRCRARRRSSLLRAPRLEFLGLHGDDEQRHARMRPAAILRALAAKLAGRGRPPGARRLTRPGNHVELGGEAGTQKLWMTSAVRSESSTGSPGRHANLVGGGELAAAVRVEVMDPPPPLLADDFDAQRCGRRRQNASAAGRKARIRSAVSTTSGKQDAGSGDEHVARHPRAARAPRQSA